MQKMTAKEYLEFKAKQESKKKSKYRNSKFTNNHGSWDSKKEYLRYLELLELQKNGKISDLKRQVRFLLIPKCRSEREVRYFADFTYFKGDAYIVEDVKSEITRKKPDYIMKRKLMLQVNNISIKET